MSYLVTFGRRILSVAPRVGRLEVSQFSSRNGDDRTTPEISEYPSWRKSWQEREDGYKPSTVWHVLRVTHKPRYLEMIGGGEAFKNHMRDVWWKANELKAGRDQSYKLERHDFLGPDLAVVHFFCNRGGRVKLHGRTDWIVPDAAGNLPVPNVFTEGMFVADIDLEHFLGGLLRYEGLENLTGLKYVQSLSVKNNAFVDDWCLDRIVGTLYRSLRHLDVSGTTVTERGLTALYKFNDLQTLTLDRATHTDSMRQMCAALQAAKPDLKVQLV